MGFFRRVNAESYILQFILSAHMAEKDSPKTKKTMISGVPNWVIPVGAVLLVLVFAWVIRPSDAGYTNTNTPTLPGNNYVPPVNVPELPSKITTITATPGDPKAGDSVTFTLEVNPLYSNWESMFTLELWVRQFGNWQKTSCYESPCTYVHPDASVGTLEYKAVRIASDGTVTDEGSNYLEVISTVQTGDTLGPKVTVYHSPQNPKSGQSVSIISLVTDISNLSKVDLFNDGEIIKTCSQSVKISNCQAAVSNLSMGTHTYYVVAIDQYGNTTRSPDYNYTVTLN